MNIFLLVLVLLVLQIQSQNFAWDDHPISESSVTTLHSDTDWTDIDENIMQNCQYFNFIYELRKTIFYYKIPVGGQSLNDLATILYGDPKFAIMLVAFNPMGGPSEILNEGTFIKIPTIYSCVNYLSPNCISFYQSYIQSEDWIEGNLLANMEFFSKKKSYLETLETDNYNQLVGRLLPDFVTPWHGHLTHTLNIITGVAFFAQAAIDPTDLIKHAVAGFVGVGQKGWDSFMGYTDYKDSEYWHPQISLNIHINNQFTDDLYACNTFVQDDNTFNMSTNAIPGNGGNLNIKIFNDKYEESSLKGLVVCSFRNEKALSIFFEFNAFEREATKICVNSTESYLATKSSYVEIAGKPQNCVMAAGGARFHQIDLNDFVIQSEINDNVDGDAFITLLTKITESENQLTTHDYIISPLTSSGAEQKIRYDAGWVWNEVNTGQSPAIFSLEVSTLGNDLFWIKLENLYLGMKWNTESLGYFQKDLSKTALDDTAEDWFSGIWKFIPNVVNGKTRYKIRNAIQKKCLTWTSSTAKKLVIATCLVNGDWEQRFYVH